MLALNQKAALAVRKAPAARAPRGAAVVVRASAEEAVPRRAALGLLAGAAALVAGAGESKAAYGEAANVFGKATNTTGFVPYSGDGFALLLPSKWNPRRQIVAPGVVLTYEDNGDAVNHVDVIARKATASSIDGYGAPDKFLNEVVRPLLGEQVFSGATRSEGGFAENKVVAASLLDVQEAKDAKGKTYYKYQLLTRTADGNEGGRHHLVTAAVGGGNLYVTHVTVGDKRWFKGVDKDALGIYNSFTVA